MKLTSFRVQNFRSIIDSGWVDIDDIAVIVGKNESGKTSLLKALWKFKPFKAEPYTLDREWPRGHRKQKSATFEVVTTRFTFTDEQRALLAEVDPACAAIETVEIGRTYAGSYRAQYSPTDVPTVRNGLSAVNLLNVSMNKALVGKSTELRSPIEELLAACQASLTDADVAQAKTAVNELKPKLVAAATASGDAALAQLLSAACDTTAAKLAKSPAADAWALVEKWIPTFVYMDDFLAFKGIAQLDQVKQRKDQNILKDDDRTILTIMAMAGLDLEQEVLKGAQTDREQRMLDMNDASLTLTNEIATRWSQKKYEVQFIADGQHFITFVKDDSNNALVPLEERSKGFQWFFSFDMKFMYETNGEFKNSVLLLDEPGMHLHAAAQRDLLLRLKEYSKNNQLIYTTHLPFMIDMSRFDNISVAEDRPGEGTKIHSEWANADKDARFTLQAALGLSWAQSLFIGRKNLVVEGVTDFWYLSLMSGLMSDSGDEGIVEELVITPAGGASKVAYLATLLAGQELKVAALLDSDQEGNGARTQLVNNKLLKDSDVLSLGTLLGTTGTFAIEDLFGDAYYVEQTAIAYKAELAGAALMFPPKAKGSIVDRVTTAFEAKKLTFNKGRVAKQIMKDVGGKTHSDFSGETLDRFRVVIKAINAIAKKWGR